MLHTRADGQVPLVDHTSSQGPVVTHMRGTLLVSSVDNLRELGCHDRYFALLASEHRDAVKYCMATSWLPIEVALAHYQACDELDLDDAQRRQLGEMMANRVAATFLSALLRATRNVGLESFRLALSQNDRLWDRMYQGGGVRIYQTGPKDVVMENFGQPLVTSRHWRTAYAAYLGAVVRMFAKSAFVKQVHPREPSATSIAFAASWV
ncbi:MAG: hypothetical protein JWN48_1128 [Myxococcaceae bacterium]|nr:hypothetical protein [Myxococcaceae bacterium]